ncbi:MAG: ABC transporter ATP-binding protein [Armatimonadota bacterium]
MKDTPINDILISNLSVSFENRQIIKDFCLELKHGEKVTLMGRSGSGKSTILKCIMGFVESYNGEIFICGKELNAESVWQIRTHLAYVAQEADLGIGTTKEVIETPFTYKANYSKRDNLKRIPELFDKLYLPIDLMEQPISNLSGGEKQRIALVCALLMDREILLLDEASSALDKTSRQAVVDYLKTLDNLTILSISHDPEGFNITDNIIELKPINGV